MLLLSGEQEGDLSFQAGEILYVTDQSDPDGWWYGENEQYVGGITASVL
jgi:hypothetical protein